MRRLIHHSPLEAPFPLADKKISLNHGDAVLKTDYTIALITEVFFDDPGGDRLRARLGEAKRQGADLAVLPELPLSPWLPARKTPAADDAEQPEGLRHKRQAAAAAEAGIALLGGAIVHDPGTGWRHNTALLFDATGALVAAYRKLHLPDHCGRRAGC